MVVGEDDERGSLPDGREEDLPGVHEARGEAALGDGGLPHELVLYVEEKGLEGLLPQAVHGRGEIGRGVPA